MNPATHTFTRQSPSHLHTPYTSKPSGENPALNPLPGRDNPSRNPPPLPPFGGGYGPGGGGGGYGGGGGGGGGGGSPSIPSPPIVGFPGGQPPSGPPGAPGGSPNGPSGPPVSIPYHLTVPRIRPELRADDLPSWDGSADTAIHYFLQVQEFAGMRGTIPDQLATYFWTRLVDVKSLNIRTWFTSQEESTKTYMRAHWTNYCTVIRDEWLGPNWQEERNHEYVNMRFRMRGRTEETPKEFIQRHILYARMLLNHEPGSAAEIRDVLRTAPPAWLVILNVETITRTGMLQSRVALHEPALIATADIQSSQAVTVDTLPSILRNMGVASSTSRPFRRFRNPISSSASAHVVSAEEDEGQLLELETPDTLVGATSLDIEAYNSSAKRQRPPPKGGYKFPKADHVVSCISPPPSPCKMCGSSKHWRNGTLCARRILYRLSKTTL